MKFDTSLFEKNDVELAKEVKSLEKYFKGDKVVRLSWINAKYIVKRSNAIIYEMSLFVKNKEDKVYYKYFINEAIKNFRPWFYIHVIRSANMFFNTCGLMRGRLIKNE